eukprot:TRINITY_DN2962_c0_g2_i4.p1 TRINITY_DN2962_c0_g2~~TRINITY_DN2962_c0_g2_i4.p1  ORF type:complete len:508 (-),score=135.13 TRINITY_DN2962_c0_g2_i4:179-1621(-)
MDEDAIQQDPVKAETTGKKRGTVDYDKLRADIEEQTSFALKKGKLNEAIENLLNTEKQLRLSADIQGTKMVVVAIIKICFEAGDWKLLNEQIVLLSKRRAQLKQAVQAVVQEAMGYVDEAPDVEVKTELIKTLSTVTAGKIYVEIERARLIKKLAKIKEEQGAISEAADIMQEVAVETFGAMAKTEKIAFILEQVRLCLDKKDYMRAQILAKKINPRVFIEDKEGDKKKKKAEGESVVEEAAPDVPPLMELKQIYYQLMIRYHAHTHEYLEIARCYQSIYDIPSVKEEPEKWMPILRKICWYLVLAPHDSMQSSLLHAAYEDKKLQDLPKFRALLKHFITMEVVRWPVLQNEYRTEVEETDIFTGEAGKKAAEDFRQRVIEHNILVISKYYCRIQLKRLAELLDLPALDTEKYLSEMVVSKAMYAKVDRPAGIVSFQGKKDSNEMLNGWATNIEKLLDLVEKSCHQIHKETMVHKVALKT